MPMLYAKIARDLMPLVLRKCSHICRKCVHLNIFAVFCRADVYSYFRCFIFLETKTYDSADRRCVSTANILHVSNINYSSKVYYRTLKTVHMIH